MAEHVYQGPLDQRQSEDPKLPVSRFRPRYRALSPEEKKLHDDIKDAAAKLESLYAQVKAGRYHSLALTELEASVMWIIKELTA